MVAMDGSKFKIVNNCGGKFVSTNLKRRMKKLDSSINFYLAAPDAVDQQVPCTSGPNAP